MDCERCKELEDTISRLESKLNVASGFVTIKTCLSCNAAYASGYVCYCGRNNSFSDKEWLEMEKE